MIFIVYLYNAWAWVLVTAELDPEKAKVSGIAFAALW